MKKYPPISDYRKERMKEKTEVSKVSYIKYLPYIYAVIIFLFIGLDFSIFTDVFHFSNTSFIQIYLFNINPINSEFFIIFGLLPVLFALAVFGIPYISVKIFMESPKHVIKKVYENPYLNLILQINLSTLLTLVIILVLGKCKLNVVYFSLSLSAVLILIISMSLWLSTWNISMKIKIYRIVGIFLFCILPLSFLWNSLGIVLSVFFIMTIFHILSFMFISSEITKKSNSNVEHMSSIFFLVVTLVGVIFYIMDSANVEAWKNNVNPKLTTNLLLNKEFLASNKHQITFDSGQFYTGKNCLNYYNTSFGDDAKYLTLSKTVNLYFQKKDDNLTCIYAVERNLYRGKPIYNLLDTGYIGKEDNKTE